MDDNEGSSASSIIMTKEVDDNKEGGEDTPFSTATVEEEEGLSSVISAIEEEVPPLPSLSSLSSITLIAAIEEADD